jgi:hypothetical protein
MNRRTSMSHKRFWIVKMPETEYFAVDFGSVPDKDYDLALEKAEKEWKHPDISIRMTDDADGVKDDIHRDRIYRWNSWKKSW